MKPLLSMQAARRHWRGLVVVTLSAAAVHGWVLGAFDGWWPRQPAAARLPTAVQVRVIDSEPVRQAEVQAPVTVPAPLVKTVVAKVVRPAAAQRPAAVPAQAVPPVTPPVTPHEPEAAPAPEAVPEPDAATAIAVLAAANTSAAPSSATAPSPAAAGADVIPRYRTQMPPATTLHYVMQRGALRGSGDLSWRTAGDRYELRLEGRVAGLAVLTQVSTGGFDAAGVAPVRFTDQRLRRGTKAANFQRAAGKISFSGPSTEFALREGTQDRLSWMVQLGAIVAADPKLRGVGAKVVMVVVGANGEMSVWAFDCTAIETVSTGAGDVRAMKFVREPREPYDTQVQVWLDPARSYLPVRAAQKSGTGDDAFELRLQSVDP